MEMSLSALDRDTVVIRRFLWNIVYNNTIMLFNLPAPPASYTTLAPQFHFDFCPATIDEFTVRPASGPTVQEEML